MLPFALLLGLSDASVGQRLDPAASSAAANTSDASRSPGAARPAKRSRTESARSLLVAELLERLTVDLPLVSVAALRSMVDAALLCVCAEGRSAAPSRLGVVLSGGLVSGGQAGNLSPAAAALQAVTRCLAKVNSQFEVRNAAVRVDPSWGGGVIAETYRMEGLPIHLDGKVGVRCIVHLAAGTAFVGQPGTRGCSPLLCSLGGKQVEMTLTWRDWVSQGERMIGFFRKEMDGSKIPHTCAISAVQDDQLQLLASNLSVGRNDVRFLHYRYRLVHGIWTWSCAAPEQRHLHICIDVTVDPEATELSFRACSGDSA